MSKRASKQDDKIERSYGQTSETTVAIPAHNIYTRISPNKLVHIHTSYALHGSPHAADFFETHFPYFSIFMFSLTPLFYRKQLLQTNSAVPVFFALFLLYLARRCACLGRLFSLLFFDRLCFLGLVWVLFSSLLPISFYFSIKSSIFLPL